MKQKELGSSPLKNRKKQDNLNKNRNRNLYLLIIMHTWFEKYLGTIGSIGHNVRDQLVTRQLEAVFIRSPRVQRVRQWRDSGSLASEHFTGCGNMWIVGQLILMGHRHKGIRRAHMMKFDITLAESGTRQSVRHDTVWIQIVTLFAYLN